MTSSVWLRLAKFVGTAFASMLAFYALLALAAVTIHWGLS